MTDIYGKTLQVGDKVLYVDEKISVEAKIEGFGDYNGLEVAGLVYEQDGKTERTFAFENEVWRLE